MKNRLEKRLKGYDMSGKGRFPKNTPQITMLEFEAQFRTFVEWYHNEHEHSELGQSPQAEYEEAKNAGFQPVKPDPADYNTYLMHFAPRQEVKRRKGFGQLLVSVKNPYDKGKLYFDIKDIDPTITTLYVAVGPNANQAAIYDQNHNFLFIAPTALVNAEGNDEEAMKQYGQRLEAQRGNQKQIRKVVADAEKSDSLYEDHSPVAVEQDGEHSNVYKMIPKNMKEKKDPEPTEVKKPNKKDLDELFSKWA